MASKADQMKAIIAKARQTLVNNKTAELEHKRAKKRARREKEAAAKKAGKEALLRLTETTEKTFDTKKEKFMESLTEHVKAVVTFNCYSEIRDKVYDSYDQIADDYKHEIRDITRTTLEAELEPVVKAELAVKYEGEVRQQLTRELLEEVKQELRDELKPLVMEELQKQHIDSKKHVHGDHPTNDGSVAPEVGSSVHVREDLPASNDSAAEVIDLTTHVHEDQLTIDGLTASKVEPNTRIADDHPASNDSAAPMIDLTTHVHEDQLTVDGLTAPKVEPKTRVDDDQTILTNAEKDEESHHITSHKGYVEDLNGNIAQEIEPSHERFVKDEEYNGHKRPDSMHNVHVHGDQPTIPSVEGPDELASNVMTQQPHYPTLPTVQHSQSPPPLSSRSTSLKRSRSQSVEDEDDGYDENYYGREYKKIKSPSPEDYSTNPTGSEYNAYRRMSQGDYLGALLAEGDGEPVGAINTGGPPRAQPFAGNPTNLQSFMMMQQEAEEYDEEDEDEEDSMDGIESDNSGLYEDEYDGQQPRYYDNGDVEEEAYSSQDINDLVENAKIAALRAQGGSQKEAINLDSDDEEGEGDTTLVN
ncbi:hypothetical protein P7C71_g870, partial [Lecanoromycetidae sp. Uapishka_2]